MSSKTKAWLKIAVLGLFGCGAILLILSKAEPAGVPHWLVIALAVLAPVCLGKAADRIWRRAA